MEGGEHGKFELNSVFRGNFKGDEFVLVIFGDFDVEGL